MLADLAVFIVARIPLYVPPFLTIMIFTNLILFMLMLRSTVLYFSFQPSRSLSLFCVSMSLIVDFLIRSARSDALGCVVGGRILSLKQETRRGGGATQCAAMCNEKCMGIPDHGCLQFYTKHI